jgi:ketosteroid isomerase-like protein
MKRLIAGFATLASIALLAVDPASLIAQEWSPAQQQVLATFDAYTRASVDGDVEEIMSYFHPEFLGWDYKQARPIDLRQIREMIEGFYASYKLAGFDVEPLAVQMQGDVAIVYVRYRETMKMGEDADVSLTGPWTATFVKDGDKWLFFSWSWIQDDT